MKSGKVCGILFIALFWINQLLVAQVTTGTISGTVSDSTGAVIPGATVNVRNTDTGISRTVTANAAGYFLVPQLALGSYEITAESAGFQTVVRSGITLTMGREAAVNFTLQVGAVAERITVTGEAPMIETTSSTVAGLISETQMKELPLNVRSYEQLAFLQPSVFFNRNFAKATNSGVSAPISAAGMRTTHNVYVSDGIDISDTSGNTPGSAAGNLMGVETLREYRVLTNNAPAQYGRAIGAVLDISTRGGTNEFHGSVFEFLRNDITDARSFFDGPNVPPLRRNQFGAVLGGPIVQDRAFFFASYEALRERQASVRRLIVPNDLAKQGILPAPTPANPNATRTVTVLPAIKPWLAIYPSPNVDVGGGLGLYSAPFPGKVREDFFTGRFDYQGSENVSYFGRYNIDDTDKIQPRGGSVLPPWMEGLNSRNQTAVLAETRILNPNLINELRFGVVRNVLQSRSELNGPDPNLQFSCCVGSGRILLSATMYQASAGQLADIGSSGRTFEKFAGTTVQLADNLTLMHGSHSFKMGGLIERFHDNVANRTETGQYRDTAAYQFQSLEQLVTGVARSFSGSIISQPIGISGRQWLYGLYIQDDYRVLSNLTLNLGVRYEWASNYSNVHKRFLFMNNLFGDVKANQEKGWTGRLCAGCLDPRFGFAWDVFSNGKMALKGGFGVYRSQLVRFLGFYDLLSTASTPGGLGLSVDNPSFPNPLVPRAGTVIRTTPSGSGAAGALIIPELPATPTALQWNLTLEHQITPTMSARLAYVASHAYHLNSSTIVNTNKYTELPDGSFVFPATGVNRIRNEFGSLEAVMHDFNSYFNSFTATLGQRMKWGLDFQASYAFSRNTDDATSAKSSGYAVASEVYLVDWRRHLHHALSGLHIKNRFVSSIGYAFPSLASPNGFATKLLSGWSLNSIITLQQGTPFTPVIGFDRANSRGQRPGSAQRVSLSPTLNGPVPICPCTMPASLGGGVQDRPERYFDPTVFVLPAAGTYGNAGRNIIIGPGLTTFDMSLTKNTPLTERMNLQFRLEGFNVFNNVNFAMPSSRIFETNGSISSTAGLMNRTFTDGRQLQFALKLLF